IMGTIVMSAIILGGEWMLLMIAFLMIVSTKEYVKMLNHKGFYPSLKVIYLTEFMLSVVVYFKRFDFVGLTLTICAMFSLMWVLFRGRQPYIANVTTTLFGMVYCGWFPLHLIFLRDLSCASYESGLGFVVMMFTSILLTDVGCYYVGTKYGKHKLAPVISPNKTIEGSIGGVVLAILSALFIGWYITQTVAYIAWWQSALVGLISTTFAQIGDLCESLLKRDAGVKDSGSSLPGHGGFLDRTDSFILTIPVTYYFCKCFIFQTEWMGTLVNFFKGLF
ncbi:MAG: phosphatidate cytidylyltransferase, partial [Alphaproteobacteria bacterium]|nr:phosphatidate cytidylyltransferase [Alphaproteobacteria bacterium]